ncbi:MAG: YhbY family RNA-binding protein [Acholeplasmatales bacterium]|nr:YhbY family RNA-binding protein [Acholeplasmatales bacterium]
MLTPKQRVYLRSLAQKIKPVFQIGKEGLSENLLNDVYNYLLKHELVKLSILQNSLVEASDCEEFFGDAGIEFVQHIGRTIVLYMHSDKAKNPIELPKKK